MKRNAFPYDDHIALTGGINSAYRRLVWRPLSSKVLNLKMFGSDDLERTLILCALVGTWLVGINEWSDLVAGRLGVALYLRVTLDFVTPFAVSASLAPCETNGTPKNKNYTLR